MQIYDADMLRDDFLGRACECSLPLVPQKRLCADTAAAAAADIHAREVIGTRGRGIIQRKFFLHEKHTEKGEQKRGFLDMVLGYTGDFPGEMIVQWEVRGARPGEK